MKFEKSKWTGCPIRYAAEIIGDKWTFLILRDLMFRDKSSYTALLQSSEKISTNILADRLRKLEKHCMLEKSVDADNKKQFIYALSKKGLDLMPTMLSLFAWSYEYDDETHLPASLVGEAKRDPGGLAKQFREGKTLVLNAAKI